MANLTKAISEMKIYEYKVINLGLFSVEFHVFPDGSYSAAEFTSKKQMPMFHCTGETVSELIEKLEVEMKDCAMQLIEHELSFDTDELMPY